MKTELTSLSQVRKRVVVEVPATDVESVFQDVLREHRKEVKIPGFRPGKVPEEMIRRRLGDELAHAATERILDTFALEALRREDLRPVRGGVVVETGEGRDHPEHAREGEDYRFTLRVDVLPPIDPQDYVGVTVTRSAVEVEPAEVESELERLRQSQTQLIDIPDRASAPGDLIAVDMEAAELGQPPVLERKLRLLKIGEPGNPPELDRGLTGRRPDEEFIFEVPFPDDHPEERLRGKLVYFKGTVKALKEARTPELNDELARQLQLGENLAEMREKVRSILELNKNAEADHVARQRLVDALLDRNPFDVPPALLDQEHGERLERIGRELQARGLQPDQVKVDWDQIIESERGRAERGVRETILLDAIARKEKLEVERAEVDAVIGALAKEAGLEPDKLRARLKQDGEYESLAGEVLRRKCLDWLYARSKIL
ncbi:MAG: trigger factor [Acidobacteria bacterium]|nr:trigger factor [Acidobacteriota bacterium]